MTFISRLMIIFYANMINILAYGFHPLKDKCSYLLVEIQKLIHHIGDIKLFSLVEYFCVDKIFSACNRKDY